MLFKVLSFFYKMPTKTKKTKKSKKTKSVKEEQVQVVEPTVTVTRTRRVVTHESVTQAFETLIADICTEIVNLREEHTKRGKTGIRFLKNVNRSDLYPRDPRRICFSNFIVSTPTCRVRT